MEGKEGWLDSFAKWKVGRLDSFAKRKVARAERHIGRFAKTKGNSADLIKKQVTLSCFQRNFSRQTPRFASHR